MMYLSALLFLALISPVEARDSAASAAVGGSMIEAGLVLLVAVLAGFSAGRAGWSLRGIIGLSLFAGGAVAALVAGK